MRNELAGLVIHLLIFTLGVSCVVFFLFIIARGAPGFGTAYNPVVWIPASIIGFLANRGLGLRSGCLVGAIGIAAFAYFASSEVHILRSNPYYAELTGGHYWRYELGLLLAPSDANCSGGDCLGKVLFTAPAVASVAYSVGACFGLKQWRTTSGSKDSAPDNG